MSISKGPGRELHRDHVAQVDLSLWHCASEYRRHELAERDTHGLHTATEQASRDVACGAHVKGGGVADAVEVCAVAQHDLVAKRRRAHRPHADQHSLRCGAVERRVE
eukprot:scaffold99386_cov75-Phaeocystis_antarctica.AAC.2